MFHVQPAWAKPRFGLWVEAEGKNQPFVDKPAFEQFLKLSSEGGFTDLYCQVYRGGRAWFPSMMADDEPYREAVLNGVDPLRDTIRAAHARGQKVHAWVNIFNLLRNFEAPLLQVIGKKAALVDDFGNSLLDYDEDGRPKGDMGNYFQLGTPAVWLEPGSPEVRRYIVETVRDLLTAYPELDGIHLDMIRFPFAIPIKPASSIPGGIDYGYGEESVAGFMGSRETASDLPQTVTSQESTTTTARGKMGENIRSPRNIPQRGANLPKGDEWDNWRRVQVTLLVAEIKALMGELVPRAELSAAVIAWPDRAYLNALQDWRGWLAGRLLDVVMPMSYTRDLKQFGYLSREASTFAGSQGAIMGIGAWLMVNDQAMALEQTKAALKAGAKGVVLFSYSNLQSKAGAELVRKVSELLSAPLKQAVQN